MVDLAVTAMCRGNQKKVVRCHIINKGSKWSLCKNFPSKLKSALTSWREGDSFFIILFCLLLGFLKFLGGGFVSGGLLKRAFFKRCCISFLLYSLH